MFHSLFAPIIVGNRQKEDHTSKQDLSRRKENTPSGLFLSRTEIVANRLLNANTSSAVEHIDTFFFLFFFFIVVSSDLMRNNVLKIDSPLSSSSFRPFSNDERNAFVCGCLRGEYTTIAVELMRNGHRTGTMATRSKTNDG